MKAVKRIIITTVGLVAGTVPAFAASGGREDNSGIVVWAFLFFCALIVVGQVFPLIRNLWAPKKGVTFAEPEKVKSEQ